MVSRAEKVVYPLFQDKYEGIIHGAVSRHGGKSPIPFRSNNIGFGVGDSDTNVIENRENIKNRFNLRHLVSANQVHGDEVHCLTESIEEDRVIPHCDALVTNQRRIGVLIGHADCQTILLYDPDKCVVAAIHSGWRGSVANITAKTISTMSEKFNSDPQYLLAAIGPSLGPCCAEFINFRSELPEEFQSFQVRSNYFDFWAISSFQLQEAGVKKKIFRLLLFVLHVLQIFFHIAGHVEMVTASLEEMEH